MSRISMEWETELAIDVAQGYMECPAVFDIDCDEYPAESFSWGGSRGTEISCAAELIEVQLGATKLPRDTIEAIVGREPLLSQEDKAAELFMEKYKEGAFA